MWLYFNRNGQLIETLEHGNKARSGTTDYEIFAYFEGVDITAFQNATLKLRKPDLTRSEYPTFLIDSNIDKKFVLKPGENSEHFENNKIYKGYYFNFSDFDNDSDQDITVLLDTPGLWEAIITLVSYNRALNVQGVATFNVENGSYSEEGTDVELEAIIAQLQTSLATKLNVENGIIKSDTDPIDYSMFDNGQVFFIISSETFENHKVLARFGGSYDTLELLYDFDASVVTPEDLTELDNKITTETNRAIGVEEGLSQRIDDIVFGGAELDADNTFTGNNTFTGDVKVSFDKLKDNTTSLNSLLNTKEDKSNKTTVLNASSTTTQYASAKTVYDFVNSSISAVAAYYITKNASGDPFSTYAELNSATVFYSGGVVRTPTRNDYAVVLADENHGNDSTRYIYNAQWEYQYTYNKQFTSAQLNAMNSGITEGKVGNYDAHLLNNDIHVTSALKNTWNAKQDTIFVTSSGTGNAVGSLTYQNNILVANRINATVDYEPFEDEPIDSLTWATTAYVNTLLTGKQDKLTAGTNITIDENNVISASGGGGGDITYATDEDIEDLFD